MSYTTNKQGEIIVSGWDKGVGTSPHKGLGNMQNVNISTETGEVMASYGRTQQSQPSMSGTLTQIDGSTVQVSNPSPSTAVLTVGMWITVSGSTIANLSNGDYYVVSGNTGNNLRYNLKATFTTTNDYINNFGAGTASFNTNGFDMGSPVASTTEFYTDANNAQSYRYYVMDANGRVWVQDSSATSVSNVTQPTWFLPYTGSITTYGSGAGITVAPSGLAVLNGWLFIFAGNGIYTKLTVRLDLAPTAFSGGTSMGLKNNTNPHTAYVGHQGKLYYTDGTYLGSIFPNTSLLTGITNIQSYASYTAVTTTGTISNLISGSLPTPVTTGTPTRIPAVFYTSLGGTIPSALTANTIYYIQYLPATNGTFEVYAAITGGSAKDIATGATGTQYFNTFASNGISAADFATLATFTPQRLNLPTFEIAQSIGEIGNVVLIGCKGNVVYPWNQVSVLPTDIINIPENNVVKILTVNNMGFLFAGSKGNIYITNGSSASGVIAVPDYCAGIPGSQATYVEPYFTWGDCMYLRGRVYFGILDQVSGKAGNCGGVWSFTPTQNMFFGDNTGLSLRLENQNSYGTYSGLATVLLNNQNQVAKSPQYFSGWYSSITSPLYGIDSTATAPVGTSVIETDLIPTGYLVGEQKKTFQNIEYKLATPLATTESVSIAYRKNGTEAYTDMGSAVVESGTDLSGYFPATFENTRWLQLRITLTPLTNSLSTFVRLTEIIIR